MGVAFFSECLLSSAVSDTLFLRGGEGIGGGTGHVGDAEGRPSGRLLFSTDKSGAVWLIWGSVAHVAGFYTAGFTVYGCKGLLVTWVKMKSFISLVHYMLYSSLYFCTSHQIIQTKRTQPFPRRALTA